MTEEIIPLVTKFFQVHIYFMEAENGLIKIGMGNVDRRFRDISNMSPVPISVKFWFVNHYEVEKILHKLFAAYRSHGEWFYPAQELLDYIEELRGRVQKLTIDELYMEFKMEERQGE